MSIQFSGMEAAKRFFRTRRGPGGGQLGLGELWASGAFAGVANTVVANPVEHIRIRGSAPGISNKHNSLTDSTQDFRRNRLLLGCTTALSTVCANSIRTAVWHRSSRLKYRACSEMESAWAVIS